MELDAFTDLDIPAAPAFGRPKSGAPCVPANSSSAGECWSLVAVQTPGAPRLTIQPTSTCTAAILWPSSSAGFTLQQNGDLDPAHWVAAPQPVADNGANKFIIVNPPGGSRFYRLFQP